MNDASGGNIIAGGELRATEFKGDSVPAAFVSPPKTDGCSEAPPRSFEGILFIL